MLRTIIFVALVSCIVSNADAAKPIASHTEPKPDSRRTAADLQLRVKRLVDGYRAAVGLSAVLLDDRLSKGCMEHAEYMRLNKDSDATAGLNAHHQRPNLPGASAAGSACGEAADLFFDVSDV